MGASATNEPALGGAKTVTPVPSSIVAALAPVRTISEGWVARSRPLADVPGPDDELIGWTPMEWQTRPFDPLALAAG